MEDNNKSASIPLLCSKGCGFYGSPNFDGLCSKCHKGMKPQSDGQMPKSRKTSVEVSSPANSSSNSPICDKSSRSVVDETETTAAAEVDVVDEFSKLCDVPAPCTKEMSPQPAESQQPPPEETDPDGCLPSSPASSSSGQPQQQQKTRPRCAVCRKNVGLTGFTCHCGGLYCGVHRYSDVHQCSYDYRSSGQKEISKANPQVLCSKVNKI